MIYNTININNRNYSSFNSILNIYGILGMIESSVKTLNQYSDKFEAQESLDAQIQWLKEEIIEPVVLKKCVYKSEDSNVVSDEEDRKSVV